MSWCLTWGYFCLERKYRKALPASERGRIKGPQNSKVPQHQHREKKSKTKKQTRKHTRRKKIAHAEPANQPTNIKQQRKWFSKVHSKFHALYSPLKGEWSHSGNKIPLKQSTHLFQIIIISKYFRQSPLALNFFF